MTSPIITVSGLTLGYDDSVLMRDVSFDVKRGDIFIIMGASGCGKSTLLRAMTGLMRPSAGRIVVCGHDLLTADAAARRAIMANTGVLFQGGALFSSMTVGENIAMPLRQYTDFSDSVINDIVRLKLAMVELSGFQDFYPSDLSGGMKKRVGLARALALDPDVVYFDEPSAGLDPVSAYRLDELISQINRNFGTTIVLVSHELESILSIGTNSIFLDRTAGGIIARGNPRELLRRPPNKTVEHFLTRGRK